MEKLLKRAYGKINLGLDVLRKRPDGYHDVKMIMQMVTIYDELTFEKINENKIIIKTDKAELPIDDNNLIYIAAKKFLNYIGSKQGLKITLNKNIPIAAGMAGGSTDAAATLLGINELLQTGIAKEELMKIAVTIGADVPFCIEGGTALSEGIGEILTPLTPPPACFLLIAKPDICVSTKYVYENLHADTLAAHPDIDGMAEALSRQDLKGVSSRLGNVLETVTIAQYPIIGKIKKAMLESGAMNSLMSGSGPTVFGLYQTKQLAEEAREKLELAALAKELFVAEFVR